MRYHSNSDVCTRAASTGTDGHAEISRNSNPRLSSSSRAGAVIDGAARMPRTTAPPGTFPSTERTYRPSCETACCVARPPQGQSYRQIAARLNQEGHRTVTGKRWGAVQVRNVVLRGAQESTEQRMSPVGGLSH